MSVIQDALKRRLAEQQQGKIARGARPAGGAAPPPTPPIAEQVIRNDDAVRPAPARASVSAFPAEATPVAQPGAGKWMFGTALVLLFAVLVGGVLFHLSRGAPLVAVPPPDPDPGAVVPTEPASGVFPSPSVPEPVTPPVGSESGNSASAVAAASAPAGSRPATEASASPPPGLDRPQWPDILVNGVMAGAEPKKRSAILNGQMIFLNQKIDEVRLIAVNEDGVRLRFQGQEIDLEIGQIASDTGL